MFGKIGIVWVAVFLAPVGAVWAGIFQVEVPADVEREDVLNPTAEIKEKLEALLNEKLSKNPPAGELGSVAFTKNGEIISPDVERNPTDGWSDNRLGFEPAGEFLNHPGSWEAARWHLREVGQEQGYNGVYALAEDIFGYPFWTHEITVEWDPTLLVEGYYNCSLATIYLRQWRDWENERYKTEPNNPNWNDDAAVLTRCMLQAWHHYWQAYWDHFGSMRRAAWIAIHNKLADDGYELGFNDLYHDDQRDDRPYYKCLDNYNTDELGTRLHNWADEVHSRIYGDIKYWRYGAANYCWWKVYNKQPNFMYAFNREFYTWLEEIQFEHPPYDYKWYKVFADTADNGAPIEGLQFSDWFLHQPILRCDHWCDDICALAVDRTKARVLAYRRYIDGATGEENEVAHSNARVYTEKQDWEGNVKGYYVIDVNNGGYGEWDFPIHNPDKGIKVTASYSLQGGPSIADFRWGIDSDAAYEDDALYGVVTDAFEGGGTVTIKKGGFEQATVPVSGKAFRWTPPSAVGPGEYELVYTAPRGGVRGYNPQVVVKDVASYFSERYYLSESYTPDLNHNDIPDALEQELAKKFVPQIQMHYGNRLIPSKVGLMVDPGRGPLVKYVFDMAGRLLDRVPYWPTEGYPMEQIFEDTKPWPTYNPPYIYEWKLVFGPDYDEIITPYWINNYEDITTAHPEDLEPALYYNIFKYLGKPVIQYWTYYPFNDWANDHEGDWEHINVKLTSADLNRAALEEVLYYFHKKYAVRTGPAAPVIDETHPLVYPGGEFVSEPTWGTESGGNYWEFGEFANVWDGFNEKVSDGGPIVDWGWFTDPNHTYERLVRNDRGTDLWWSVFPYGWGRQKEDITVFSYLRQESPNSPVNHHCFEVYRHPDYTEYGTDGDTNYTSPIAGASETPAPSDAEPFGPLLTTVGTSPSVGQYLSPAVADRPSPLALAPESGGADTPGGDNPPAGDAPTWMSPANSGGDALSPGAGAAPFGRSGPPEAAAPASPLACAPNPVTANAAITFKVETPCAVELAVYDLSGRRVATLAEGHYAAGEHAAYWQAGVPTGVYILRLQAGSKVAVKKVVVAK